MILRENDVPGAVIGGVAVVLHGYVRTTKDVDVFVQQPLRTFKPILESAGAKFDRANRQFLLDDVPVHLVDEEMIQPPPKQTVLIEEIETVSLPDLINMKLRSGTKNLARAQDIADVVGLIRERKLTNTFAARIDKSLRAEFRKLVAAVRGT